MVKLVKIPLPLFVVLQFVDGFTYQNSVREIEICGSSNGHRKYLKLGDSGEIVAGQILVPKVNYIKIYITYVTILPPQSSFTFIQYIAIQIKIIDLHMNVNYWIKFIDFLRKRNIFEAFALKLEEFLRLSKVKSLFLP